MPAVTLCTPGSRTSCGPGPRSGSPGRRSGCALRGRDRRHAPDRLHEPSRDHPHRARRRARALPRSSGYLYFLPLIGREPIRWQVAYRPGSSCCSSPCRWTPSPASSSAPRAATRSPAGGAAPGMGAEPAHRRAHRRRGDVGGRRRHHVRPGDGGVLRLEPGKAQRRRPRLARVRAPVQLRHPGQLAPGRQRRPWPGLAAAARPASARPASARPASASPAATRTSTTTSTWRPTTPSWPGSTSRRTADPAPARHAGSAF